MSALRRGLLVLAPFVLVTMGRGIGAAWSEPNATSEAVVASSVAPTSGPRVVVLLFDGMDQETALSTADASRELPAFSRLLNETVHFDQAIAPPNRRTLNSLPSITLGRVVVASEPSGRSDLALTFRDGTHGLWSRLPNMFGISQSEGVKSFVAGWAIPYCRIFGGSISNCTWRPYLLRPDAVGAGLRRDTNFLVASVPGLFRLARLMGLGAGAAPNADEDSLVSWHLDSYRSVHARARIGVRDSSYRLVFVHYPVPHEPIIFDRQSGLLEGNPKDGGYLDNQILADHALEELRGDMEKADTWNRTTVVVMSDHAPKNQPGDRHPILMAKLANSLVPLAVREPASLSGVFGLVLGTLRDQVHTPSEVVDAVMKAND